jgi:Flp pilus assembly protein TadD
MKRCSFVSFLLAAVLLGAAALAWAQAESATVQGTVVDAQGQPLAGVVVAFHGANTGASFSVKTDKKGAFLRIGSRADVYHVTVTKDGQQIAELNRVTISYGDNPPLKITASGPASPAAAAAPASPAVALTPAQQQVLDELKKQAAAGPKKDDKAVADKFQAGQAALSGGNFEQAIPLFTAVTTMDPMNEGAWAQLGYCYAQLKNNDLAIPALEKAVALNPNYGSYHANLGIAFAKSGKMDEAMTELASAVQVDPANAARYYMYEGLVLAQEKKTEPAVAAYDKAIAADSKLADAYFFKGLTLLDQAQQVNGKTTVPPGTIEAFKKYLELAPNGPRAAAVREQLAKLGG